MSLLVCRAVTKRYERPDSEPVAAVRDVDLVVEPGTFVSISGPSGSGKTTLLGLLAGLELPDSGKIELLGHDLARLSLSERARLRQRSIGIVFQSFGLIASLRVIDNVALPLALAGIGDRERSERAAAVLAEVGLAGAARARIDELSGGERQRIGVARALVGEPAIVLADEPTGSLDEASGEGVLGLLIAAVRERGASLVLVTHDRASAARADRRLEMLDGRISDGVLA